MNLWLLKPGHKVRTQDGAEAEVLAETEDGFSIEVKYLKVPDDPPLAGTEDVIGEDEVEVLLGVVKTSSWRDEVTVVLHYAPESAEGEAEYRAETMRGVPHNAVVSGSDRDSAEAALDQLLNALRAFGFRGKVSVEDATYIGATQQYDVEVR